MTQAAIATKVHETLDVHRDLAAKIAFDLEGRVEHFADLLDVTFVEILRLLARSDARAFANFLRARGANSIDVLKRDNYVLATGKIYACDTSHSKPLLTLPLLVARVGANHTNDALAANDLALVTDLFDAGANLHDEPSYAFFCLILPRVGSKGES